MIYLQWGYKYLTYGAEIVPFLKKRVLFAKKFKLKFYGGLR